MPSACSSGRVRCPAQAEWVKLKSERVLFQAESIQLKMTGSIAPHIVDVAEVAQSQESRKHEGDGFHFTLLLA